MKINIQLFGGRGAISGGNYSGTSKPPNKHKPNSTYTQKKTARFFKKDGMTIRANRKKIKIIQIMAIQKNIQ